MKKLIQKFTKNRTLAILILILVVSFILGIFFIAMLDKEGKELILTSIGNFSSTIIKNKQNNISTLTRSLGNNLILDILIWLLGISIIGIPLVLIVLGFKSFVLGFTLTSFIFKYKFKGVILGVFYIIPHIINLLTLFVLSYYSVQFSLMIFNFYFRKKEYNKNVIVKRYLKVLFIATLIFITSSFIEAFIVPLILKIIL